MADFNDFLTKLGLNNTIPEYKNSPLDLQAPDDAPINKVAAEPADPSDFEPAMESESSPNNRLMSQKDIDAIHALPPAPEMLGKKQPPMPASVNPTMPTPSVEKTPIEKKTDLLQQLLDAQKKATEDNSRLSTASIISQLGNALGASRGGKATDISGILNSIKDQNNAPIANLKQQIDETPKILDIKRATEMGDPASDISKYTRETAYAMLKKLNPEKDFSGKLDNMSADQIQKLPGMKNIGASAPMEWSATDRVDSHGNPIRYNRRTGEYSTADGKLVLPGDYTARDIARKDALTGGYGYVTKNGMDVVGTNHDAGMAKAGTDAQGKPKEYTYSDIAKGAPEQGEKFLKMKKDFDTDMKESRDTATAVTNLASKLAGGDTKGVDSGMLGGIQTQAAKMAGQKGVLTDQDLVKFAGAGGWEAAAKRAVQNAATGKMSQEDLAFFKRFGDLMGHSLEKDIENRSQSYVANAKQVLDTTAPGISDQNVAKMLGTGLVAPAVQGKKTSGKQDGKIDSYAKDHQLSYDQAKAILVGRGYKPNE